MSTRTIKKRLKEYFDALPNVRLAFLFGSAAKDNIRSESDIDVAVQFQDVPDAFEVKRIQEEIAGILSRPVDLVILNEASPIIRMQVLKNGILLLDRDSKYYPAFFSDTISQYEDLKIIRKPSEKAILKGRIYG